MVAFAASYFARGYLAGHHRFGAYGLLVLLESTSRCLFAVAVAVGIAEGQDAVAFGMLAAPIASLTVVPFALRWVHRSPDPPAAAESVEAEFTLAHGTGFAAAVLLVMLSEQTFINAGPLIVNATEGGAEGAALAGFTFNVLLIARAPLQLFQSIQAPILPHLTKMRAEGATTEFDQTVRVTLTAISGFAAIVTLALLAVGPWAMEILFGSNTEYGRGGLALVGAGMGLYLAAATLSQGALARGQTKQAAVCWVASAAAFARGLPAGPGLGRQDHAGRGRICRRRRGSVRIVALGLPATGVESAAGMATHIHTCPLCEATCGLRIETDNGDIKSIRGDQDDVFSRGYICPKAHGAQGTARGSGPAARTARAPRRRAARGELGRGVRRGRARLAPMIEQHGRDAVAVYLGNPNAHNLAGERLRPGAPARRSARRTSTRPARSTRCRSRCRPG